jgi:hypothetical protein
MPITYLDDSGSPQKITYLDDSDQNQPSQTAVDISALARPLLTGGGAIAGMVAGGGPETPVGFAGGALGYGAGKAAADLLDRKLGLKTAIQSLPGAIQETAGDIKSGAESSTANLLVNPIMRGAGNLALKGASAYFGPSEGAINAQLTNPDLQESSFPKTADDLADNLNTLQTNLKAIEDKVWGSLVNLKTVPKNVIDGMLDSVKADIAGSGGAGAISDADQAAYDALDRLSGKVDKIVPTNAGQTSVAGNKVFSTSSQPQLNQTQIREMLQSARNDVNFSDPTASPKNEALLAFTHNLSDYLKSQNPQYAELIQQSADRTALLDNAERAFSLNKQSGQFVPSNTTASKLQGLLKPGNVQNQQVANQVQNLTGMNLQQEAQNAQYAGEFQKTATQGSRRAVMGSMMGGAIGGVFGHSAGGAAMGAMAGGAVDKFGAQNLGNILNLVQRLGLNQTANPIASLGILAALAGGQENK